MRRQVAPIDSWPWLSIRIQLLPWHWRLWYWYADDVGRRHWRLWYWYADDVERMFNLKILMVEIELSWNRPMFFDKLEPEPSNVFSLAARDLRSVNE